VIQLVLNNPEFQANLFSLDKPEAWAVLKTLKLLQAMTWEQYKRARACVGKGHTVSGSTRCESAAAAGPWPGAKVRGCAFYRSTPIPQGVVLNQTRGKICRCPALCVLSDALKAIANAF
jgi:hypothetical protein